MATIRYRTVVAGTSEHSTGDGLRQRRATMQQQSRTRSRSSNTSTGQEGPRADLYMVAAFGHVATHFEDPLHLIGGTHLVHMKRGYRYAEV